MLVITYTQAIAIQMLNARGLFPVSHAKEQKLSLVVKVSELVAKTTAIIMAPRALQHLSLHTLLIPSVPHTCQETFQFPATMASLCYQKVRVGIEILTMIIMCGYFSPLSILYPTPLSTGMSCELLTTAGQPVQYANGTFSQQTMHQRADGAGVVPHPTDDGWYYVSNSETKASLGGGVGTLRFNANGGVIGYERTLFDTSDNCGGGGSICCISYSFEPQ